MSSPALCPTPSPYALRHRPMPYALCLGSCLLWYASCLMWYGDVSSAMHMLYLRHERVSRHGRMSVPIAPCPIRTSPLSPLRHAHLFSHIGMGTSCVISIMRTSCLISAMHALLQTWRGRSGDAYSPAVNSLGVWHMHHGKAWHCVDVGRWLQGNS